MNVALIYIRYLFPQISTIVILCGIFCSNRSTYKIEKVHKNALRVTLNDYTSSHSDILEVVKRPSIYIYIYVLFKSCLCGCRSNTSIHVAWRLLQPCSMKPWVAISMWSDSHPMYIYIYIYIYIYGINIFTYQGSKIWNNLPQGIKGTTCLIACNDLIVNWQGPTCKYEFYIMCDMSEI